MTAVTLEGIIVLIVIAGMCGTLATAVATAVALRFQPATAGAGMAGFRPRANPPADPSDERPAGS